MNGERTKMRVVVLLLALLCFACTAVVVSAQRSRSLEREEAEFGPVVRAYLGYLRAQQEVVDDRVSRREINQTYYRRNSNRIRALKQMALRIARETHNDYLPELEAVALDEFDTLFFDPLPTPETLVAGETLNYTFRFLGMVLSGREKFYLFARLDPYEQAELKKKSEAGQQSPPQQPQQTQPPTPTATDGHSSTRVPAAPEQMSRPRRVNTP
ncbi:MAG TPA: hypothetical protein VF666_07595 [Pyrinomonadaceae bacterium]